MLETAVEADSPFAVTSGGQLQNGMILGNDGAVFLAKFLTKIVVRYNNLCEEAGIDPRDELDRKLYKSALEEQLLDLALEDMENHGRLLALKEQLVSLVDPDHLDVKSLSLF